ncbi:unnamed protein product [Triticum turgidum subsp. durum]|uniref:Bowman-Birk serine protease inhibitors family domain-containing protein n=1 Tax=Triticum turgidum subsp. durum TaxID=4567 RepID=A0A9R0RAF0_TRITD|nr:unnamed protein product [Triticum turgidum subsp. durum]
MEMRRCSIPSILLMHSLGAALLIAGHPSVADEASAILLPSQDKDQVVMATPRPWKCCDVTVCTRSIPPTCSCQDVVDNCAPTCEDCNGYVHPPRRVCLDRYTGDPGPRCTDAGAGGN